MRFSALISFMLFFGSSLFSATIHVPADQPTIQAGIDVAVPGDTVLVADGTYTGNGNRDIDFGGKGIVLKSENGPDVTFIDCQGTEVEPHRGFNFHSGEDSSAVVDGFTIQGGYGPFDFGTNANSVGGGIKCDSSSSPNIINNIISGNSAFFGGGIYCLSNSNPTIRNNYINGNSANDENEIGGGILCVNSDPTISNNTVSGNRSRRGGGIACLENSNPTISNNTISGNSTGLFGTGGGIYCRKNSNPTISNNIVNNNSAFVGGGIVCFENSNPTISNNTISGNSAIGGGGIFCEFSSPTISNNTISRNSTGVLGRGGGIYCNFNSNPTITNNTISGNSASLNGAGLFLLHNSHALIENTVFAFNSGSEAIWCDSSSNTTLTCCDVYGNSGGDWVGCIADQSGINGNFSADPLFCDTAASDFHLDVFSPCLATSPFNACGVLIGALDVGCENLVCGDADGDGQVTYDDLDFMITFYFAFGPAPNPLTVADLNIDGVVDLGDIMFLAEYLNGIGPAPCAGSEPPPFIDWKKEP